MSRKIELQRDVLPDPLTPATSYCLINRVMLDGKRGTAASQSFTVL